MRMFNLSMALLSARTNFVAFELAIIEGYMLPPSAYGTGISRRLQSCASMFATSISSNANRYAFPVVHMLIDDV